MAAAGLALRGHHVVWLGAAPPARSTGVAPAIVRASGPPLWIRDRADLVLAGGHGIVAAAVSGWCAGAHGMVVALDPAHVRRLGWVERWAWGSLDSAAIHEAAPPDPEEDTGSSSPALAHWSVDPPPAEPDPTHADVETLERACERWLARRRGHAPRPCVFLDRDGTLVVEKGYLSSADDLELMPAAARGLVLLRDAGWSLVVVSNQSGVGRGFFSIERVHEAMARLRVELREHGVELDAIHFCPHRPDAGCECRKPGVTLLQRAAADLTLALRGSAMVGDKLLDVQTGHAAKALGILVRTGYGRDEERRVSELSRPPDFVADDLESAALWLLSRGDPRDTGA